MELLTVLAVIGVLAAMALPLFDVGAVDRLKAAAQIVLADLDDARNLAVYHNSEYRIAFDAASNQYTLSHIGDNSALEELPVSSFGQSNSAGTQRTADLSKMPGVASVELVAVEFRSGAKAAAGNVDFQPTGEASAASPAKIHLAAGEGDGRRYMFIEINWRTGLTSVGDVTARSP